MSGVDFREVILFVLREFNKGKANVIFNGVDFDPEDWNKSLGKHLWDKWENYMKKYKNDDSACMIPFILELDSGNLQKLIDYALVFNK